MLCVGDAQMKTRYGTTRWDLLRASMQREFTLVVRQKFLYLFRTSQVHRCALPLPAAPTWPAVLHCSGPKGCAWVRVLLDACGQAVVRLWLTA